jgi:acyl-CoA synthetase (AMP-forming)/AMP-acid ligase II
VEEALYGLAGVAEVAVFGIADPRWIEAVVAVIVRAPGAELSEQQVSAHGGYRRAYWIEGAHRVRDRTERAHLHVEHPIQLTLYCPPKFVGAVQHRCLSVAPGHSRHQSRCVCWHASTTRAPHSLTRSSAKRVSGIEMEMAATGTSSGSVMAAPTA